MDDKEPVNESGDEVEDRDDGEGPLQVNPARPRNQTLPPLRQVSPEDQELLSGISEAASSSASFSRNRNNNQHDGIFYTSRHLVIRANCSQLTDALLSPRHYSLALGQLSNEPGENLSTIGHQDLPPVRQGQSGHRDLPSGTEASSSQDQNVVQPEEASSGNVLASNRRHQRVSSLPDSEHSNVSSLGSNERGGSLLAESRGSDCASPLQSSSVRETKLIPQPGKKARKSFKLKEANTSSATGSFKTGIQSTSEHSDASSIETNERGGSLSAESRGSDCASPLQSSSVRETKLIPQPGKKARKSFKSKEANTSSATGSFKTGIQSTSEHSDVSSIETNERGASLLGESRASDCSSPLQSSSVPETKQIPKPRKTARKSCMGGNTSSSASGSVEASDSSEPTAGPLISRKRKRTSSGSSENENSRKRSKVSPSSDESSDESSSPSVAERTLDKSPVSVGASTGRERSEQPYLDILPGHPSGSGHQPVVSADRPSPDLVAQYVSPARERLFDVLREADDSGTEDFIERAREYLAELSRSLTFASVTKATKFFIVHLEEREKKKREEKKGRGKVECMLLETYNNFMKIVILCLVSAMTVRSSLDFHSIMLNYRNFREFYENFTAFWTKNKNLNMLGEEEVRQLRVNKGKIERYFSIIKPALMKLLYFIQRTNPDFLNEYEEDLSEHDKLILGRNP